MSDQFNVGQLQSKMDNLKIEYDLQQAIKDNNMALKIQRSRDKICEILRREQEKKPIVQVILSEPSIEFAAPTEKALPPSSFNDEVLQRRNYIFQFKLYLKRKKERQIREQEFKLFKMLDVQTEAIQKWVTKDSNETEMLIFFYSQIDHARKGTIHELQVKQFFQDNPLIMTLFNLDRNNLQSALDTAKTAQRFHFTKEEFLDFLVKYQIRKPEPGYKEYIHLFDPLYKKVDLISPRILLLKDTKLLKRLFQQIEQNGVADLDDYIRLLRQSENVPLFDNATHIIDSGLNLLLENLLQLIEITFLESTEQMISWNEFLKYLDNLNEDEDQEPEPETAEIYIQEQERDEESYFYDRMSAMPQIQKDQEPIKVPRVKKPRCKSATYTDVEKMKITVPLKPLYQKREKHLTRREVWVQKWVQSIKEEEEQVYKYKPFRANSVPYKVRDRKLYQQIIDLQNIKRRENKMYSQVKTLENQQPFSFYERDRVHKERMLEELSIKYAPEEQPQFRASPIPWYCSLKLMDRKRTEERQQQETRKKIRKFWLESISKLPPRMQEHMEKKLIEDQLSKRQTTNIQNQFKHKPVPNFELLYRQFQSQLEQSKAFKKSTVPVSPKFNASHKQPDRSYMDDQQNKQQSNKVDPLEKARKALAKKPIKQPRSTKKFDAQVEDLQYRKALLMQEKEREYIEELQRMEKKQLFLPRVQQSWAIADHQKQLQEQAQQKLIQQYQEQKEQEQSFNEMMRDIFVRVYQRPLLMEIESLKSQPLELQEQQQPYDMNPIGEQEDEESEQQHYSGYKKHNHDDDDEQEDPEGVEDVGDQAEQSLQQQEYDGQEIEDGEFKEGEYNPDNEDEYLDLDNIDPALLEQMQRQALAEQYGITEEQLEQFQREAEQEEEGEQENDFYERRHSY